MWRLGFKQFTGVLAMKISSKYVRHVALAASVVVTGAAFAAFNMDAPTAETLTYASDLKYNVVGNGILVGTSTNPGTVQVKLGNDLQGQSGTNTRFLRLDLVNATFGSAVSGQTPAASTNGSGDPTSTVFSASNVFASGGTGDAKVIYQVTAGASGNKAADIVSFKLPPLVVTSNAADVTVTYKAYSSAEAALDGTGTPLSTKTATLANFKTGLSVSGTAATSTAALATVSSGYKTFGTSAASVANTGILGTIVIAPATGVSGRTGSAVSLADLLDGSTAGKIVLSGDFSAAGASGVFLGNALCAPNVPVTNGVFTASSATVGVKTIVTLALPTNLASAPYGTAGTLCYTADGTTAINKSSAVTGVVTVAASTNSTAATSSNITLAAVSRDGTSLQVPFVQVPTGWIARIVLTNTGTTAASYTGTVVAGPSNVSGGAANAVATNGTLTGSIAAGSQVVIEGTAMPTFTQSQRGYVTFDIGGVNSVINGVYQLVNATTGSVTNQNMVRPSNAYGTTVQ